MRGTSHRHLSLFVILAALILPAATHAQQTDTFHWIDFHADKDQPVVVWVERALANEQWTSIREIGVMYDAALVVTTERASPDAMPASDTFQIWNVNLTNRVKTPLLKGVNLRWVGWMQLVPGAPREPAVLYDDCRDCAATTYFTTFRFDMAAHILEPRWMRGGQAAPVWTGATPAGVSLTQIYAQLEDLDGRQFLGTWSHLDYGNEKPAQDYVYRYDVDPFSGLDRTELVANKDGEALKQKLCSAPAGDANLARGQGSELCVKSAKPERRPVTTPPANNRGRSVPPGTRPR